MKTKTTEQSKAEPPASAGGEDIAADDSRANGDVSERDGHPPAHAGGTDNDAGLDALREENEQLRSTIRFDRAHRRITGELERAGARNPELLFGAIKGDLQFDDAGEAANAAALVARLKAEYPQQFAMDRPAGIDGGAGVNKQPRLTRDALRRMSAAEVAELDWAEVRRVLAN